MKSLVILGAGQMGMAALELIHSGRYQVVAVGDNDSSKWNGEPLQEGLYDLGRQTGGIRRRNLLRPSICSVETALRTEPDLVLIGVMGKERALDLTRQARQAGYKGEVIRLHELCELLDVRGRTLCLMADRILSQKTEGCVAELGVYRGDTARLINLFFPDKELYLFDTFTGFDQRDLILEKKQNMNRNQLFKDTSVKHVLNKLPFPEKAIIKKGYFPDTTVGLEDTQYAFVSLDPDLYAPLLAGLNYFYPRLSKGGMILVHDYNNKQFPGAKKAVHDFEKRSGTLQIIPLADLHGSCVIIK